MGGKQSQQVREELFTRGQRAQCRRGATNFVVDGQTLPKDQPPGRTIVCLHGLNANLSQYEKVAQGFVQMGFTVVRFDLFGHGLSDSPRGSSYTPQLFMDQLDDLLSHLEVTQKITLIGFSMGGFISTNYAVLNPQRIDRLVLLAPAGMLKDRPKSFTCILDRMGYCLIPCVPMCASPCCVRKNEFDGMFNDPNMNKEYAEQVQRRFKTQLRKNLSTMMKVGKGMPLWENYPVFRSLAALRRDQGFRVVFLWGTHDDVVPLFECYSELWEFFDLNPPLMLYRGCKHQLLVEKAQDVFTDIAAFLLDRPIPQKGLRPAPPEHVQPQIQQQQQQQQGGAPGQPPPQIPNPFDGGGAYGGTPPPPMPQPPTGFHPPPRTGPGPAAHVHPGFQGGPRPPPMPGPPGGYGPGPAPYGGAPAPVLMTSQMGYPVAQAHTVRYPS
uniref:Serine aminopeptidase S33 domain-containing protein n=1 Tax=Chromera velia CCMP2878 TaxID=1169474 RepID=A0A0G4FM18_9ALVE|eukprot:Cvel_3489.t1-p1 / transcript=Cvel_3489.t1 / gene=Cvel_3489 / organism=Chromera_velia_CCMP2878 / gene_product=Uncharacterized protein Mb2734, putative / transcript_product=Uncharacterized protein Mb2734, putative / location=Cvel_scaffold141:5834-8168(+) / protein_length=437 / sequence_SO=supercontig / SO=protein_coding / is_pseudo=false